MKGLLLISGGIDSPVAGYLMHRQGLELAAVHFSNYPFSNTGTVTKARQLVERLRSICKAKILFHTVNLGKAQQEIRNHCDSRYQCVLCKRLMYRTAETMAKKYGYEFLITGENIGQVASQTIENLAVIENAVKIPVLRPLLCNDKLETIKTAKEIGTFDISTIAGDCCRLVPRNPATKATQAEIEGEEIKLTDMDNLVAEVSDGL